MYPENKTKKSKSNNNLSKKHSVDLGNFSSNHFKRYMIWNILAKEKMHGYNFVLNEWTKKVQKYQDRFTKSEQTAKHDLVCKPFTPPRPSKISEKTWSTKVKPFLTSHLWYKAMLKIWKKSWKPFTIYQLNSTANPAHFYKLWPAN